MKKVKFVFGIHNHQPVGNFDFVFEEAYQKSYLPFLQILQRHPKIRIAIHFTGILLDWLEKHHPELLTMVKEMTARGQLEVMSGAYYEPILSVIPVRDAVGQIQKQTKRVKQLFGYQVSGMWLAERVWEPTLPSTLFEAGMKYTVIDDTHFKYAGLTDNDLNGYFISEDQGKTVNLFPINKHLRYTIPFQAPEETLKVLRDNASEHGQNLIVFADDGEKFGVWPDTYQHVYENGWLEDFFSLLEENLDWIEMLHFDEVLPQIPPKDKIYLPTASYAEMMHWALFNPTYHKYEQFEQLMQDKGLDEEFGIFVRGGFWRNFMAKYPEINVMHKKMLRVSDKLWAAPQEFQSKLGKAFDHLWAGQCNCPYWHGVFGGLYLGHLRYAIFNNLIDAEKILDKTLNIKYPQIEIRDFDVDGRDEVLVETEIQNAYFRPASGAALFEYDFKPASRNLLDTMSRKEEGYHSKLADAKIAGETQETDDEGTKSIHDIVLAKEEGLSDYLNYDWYERSSFIDHFMDAASTIEDFDRAKYKEEGDFVNQPYKLLSKRLYKDRVVIVFQRDGHVWHEGNFEPLSVRKKITVFNKQARITSHYEITNHSQKPLSVRFALEFNFGLQAGHADDRYYYNRNGRLSDSYLDSSAVLQNQNTIGLRDEYLRTDIQLNADKKGTLWRLPVETISLSEAGFERVYQSSCVLFFWDIRLDKKWNVEFTQDVELL